MKKLALVPAIIAAGAAHGLGIGAGAFGGAALPTGGMAADLALYYPYSPSGGNVGYDGGDMKASAKLGARAYLGVLPGLEVEAAFAYHFNHPQKDWNIPNVDEPSYRIIPITAGANYVVPVGPVALYGGGGGGYYLAKGTLGGSLDVPPFGDVKFTGDMNVNKPGFYVGGGLRYYLGKFSLDVGPRFNYVMNDGTYDVDVEYNVGGFRGSIPFEVEKGFNDSFVDILVGANYYFM
jgi:hypothetical protein